MDHGLSIREIRGYYHSCHTLFHSLQHIVPLAPLNNCRPCALLPFSPSLSLCFPFSKSLHLPHRLLLHHRIVGSNHLQLCRRRCSNNLQPNRGETKIRLSIRSRSTSSLVSLDARFSLPPKPSFSLHSRQSEVSVAWEWEQENSRVGEEISEIFKWFLRVWSLLQSSRIIHNGHEYFWY